MILGKTKRSPHIGDDPTKLPSVDEKTDAIPSFTFTHTLSLPVRNDLGFFHLRSMFLADFFHVASLTVHRRDRRKRLVRRMTILADSALI